ncbi:MAG: alpha-xylosidase, partial [Anaerolineae bacterium]|nr:alpha-xylosidase [Anaerolineae bacterium]
ESHDFLSLPLLVRPNTVIPIGARTDKPDYDYSDGITLHIFELKEDQQVNVEIPNLSGQVETIFEVARTENIIHIQRHGSEKDWAVSVAGTRTNASAQTSELKIELK